MINYDSVKKDVRLMSGMTDTEVSNYSSVIQNAIDVINSMLKSDTDETDSRVVHLAGAKAYYHIALILSAEDNITTFTAGDITMQEYGDPLFHARELLALAENDCSQLISDSGFAFLGV